MAFGSFDRKNASQPMAEINMVPLIDVVLVLLVIFIVTAPLLTNAVKLDLPKASSATDVQKADKINFAIDSQGALFWELRTAISLARLRISQDRPADAHHILVSVYGKFTEGFEISDMRRARTMMGQLSTG